MSVVWLTFAALCGLYTALELGRLLERGVSRRAPRAFDLRTGEPLEIRFAPPRPGGGRR